MPGPHPAIQGCTHSGGSGGPGSRGLPCPPRLPRGTPRKGSPSLSLGVFICNSGIIIAPASHGCRGD